MEHLFATIDRFSRRVSSLDRLVEAVAKRVAPKEEAVACNDCLKWTTPCLDGIITYAYGDLVYYGAVPYCVPPWCYLEYPC